MSLIEKQVPLDAEDYKILDKNKRWNIGCLIFFAIIAVLAFLIYLKSLIDGVMFVIIALICGAIILFILWANKGFARGSADTIKKVITIPVKTTISNHVRTAKSTELRYYVVTDEKWSGLGLNYDEKEYQIEKEFYEQLKEGDIIEIHKLLNDYVLKIAKVADAPPENPGTLET